MFMFKQRSTAWKSNRPSTDKLMHPQLTPASSTLCELLSPQHLDYTHEIQHEHHQKPRKVKVKKNDHSFAKKQESVELSSLQSS